MITTSDTKQTTTPKLGAPVGVTLDRFIKRKEDEFPYASGELSQLLRDIALAAKIVNREISRSGLIGVEGAYGKDNIQGEEQQKLDVIANIRFIRAFRNGGEVAALVSEEEDKVIEINQDANYIVAIDPLDGSSNIDVNVSIGTIFSIYRRKSERGTPIIEKDYLQKGSEQVAAGYVLYGSSTMLVYTTGCGVNGFTYEPSLGEFFLSHANITTPASGKIYSINEGNYNKFDRSIQEYVKYCMREEMTSRYIGSLVADFHRNLLKGGIYLYPPMRNQPSGKLRLMYECNALAFLVEQAGGRAIDGKRRILEIQPKSLHERSPFFIGSSKLVDSLQHFVVSDLRKTG
ncbi:MAG: class 1 fructose-bisphosphatase [Cyclobacteriaceae bacterium]